MPENNGLAIRKAMLEADITVTELADRMGKPASMISRWRHNGCDSVTNLQQVAKHCGMSLEELLELA